MADFDYSRSVATALRLIDRFGRDMTLSVPADATSDDGAANDPNEDGEPFYPGGPAPAPSPDPAPPADTITTVRGVQTEAKASEMDGTLIRADQLRILVAGDAVTSTRGTIDGHQIEHVVPVKPGPVVVMTKVYASR